MQGEMITFESQSGTCQGYLALPESGKGPSVIVLQEWWGLVDHIKEICDRFAAAGFIALAPDLYHGESTSSPDDAGRMMMAINIERTANDLRGAVQYLLSHAGNTSKSVGTVGFCMGGQLSLFAACSNEQVGACVNFYGIHPDVTPDIASLEAPVLGFFAENDSSVPPSAAKQLEADLKAAGKKVSIHIYPNADHAFFNNTRPEVYHQAYAEDAWDKTLTFFRQELSQ
ncbi:dienelactone hydrolase [Aliidiomarina taiwanensis]|uniref:Dienelactone hydrolase n=1 Tax=Aliidiomarina taiwanensis TaxID=946228 RepID=A0A432X1H7_9GAMM|nr:dienelactone hydrolase family protein [Aliidiomarina taiwanensis]RUO40457.1 dienelactone hydrolase [Aliidiomarina taiwanensis]